MALAAVEEKFWQAFCNAIERPDLVSSRLVTGDAAARVRGELQALFKARPLNYWVEMFDKVDCCASPVLTLEEAMGNEHLVARRMFVATPRRPQGKMTQFAFPVKFSDFTFAVDRQAPERGEHTDQLLEALGYSAERVAELKRKGVV